MLSNQPPNLHFKFPAQLQTSRRKTIKGVAGEETVGASLLKTTDMKSSPPVCWETCCRRAQVMQERRGSFPQQRSSVLPPDRAWDVSWPQMVSRDAFDSFRRRKRTSQFGLEGGGCGRMWRLWCSCLQPERRRCPRRGKAGEEGVCAGAGGLCLEEHSSRGLMGPWGANSRGERTLGRLPAGIRSSLGASLLQSRALCQLHVLPKLAAMERGMSLAVLLPAPAH